jgi:hypothetical protein
VILGGTEQLIIYLGQLGLCAIQVRNGVTLLVFERAHHIFNMRLLVLVQCHDEEVAATASSTYLWDSGSRTSPARHSTS